MAMPQNDHRFGPQQPPPQQQLVPQQWIRVNQPAPTAQYPPGPYPQGQYPQGPYPQGPYPQGPPDWVGVAELSGARPFRFDGGAGSYLGISILSVLLTVFTLGIAAPWAICMRYRWQAEHTLVFERRVRFTGTGMGLFGNWIKWWALCFITLGIYSFWVAPRLTRWIVEHQTFR